MLPLRSACLVAVAITATAIAEDSPLVWKFKPGDEHHYRMTQDMQMEMALGLGERKVSTGVQQLMDMTWKVDQLDDQGRAKVVQKVDRIRMDMQAPGQPEMKYDTDSDEAPAGFGAMLHPLFKAMTENPFTMNMSPRGELSDMELPEAFSNALKNVPGAAMMGEMFTDEGFLSMMQKSSLVLPTPEDLTVGHEWSTTSEMKNPQIGTITSTITYRYLGPREVKGKEFEVFSIALEMDYGDGMAGVTIEVENQDSHGEVLFDREAGRLHSSKLQQDLDMAIGAGGQTMKQKLLQKVFFELVEEPSTEK